MPQLIFGQPRRTAQFQAPFPRQQSGGNSAAQLLATMMQQQHPGAQQQINGQLALEALRQSFATQGRQDELSLLRDQFDLQKEAQATATEGAAGRHEAQLLQNQQFADMFKRSKESDALQDRLRIAAAKKTQTKELFELKGALSSAKETDLLDEFNVASLNLQNSTSLLEKAWPVYLRESEVFEFLSNDAEDAASDIRRSAVEVTKNLNGTPAQAAAAFNIGQDMMTELRKGGGSSIFFGIGGKGRANIWLDPEIVAFRSAMESQQVRGKIDQYNKLLFKTGRDTENLRLEGLSRAISVQIEESEDKIPGLEEALAEILAEITRRRDSGTRQQQNALEENFANQPSSLPPSTSSVPPSSLSGFFDKTPDDETSRLLQSFLGAIQQ